MVALGLSRAASKSICGFLSDCRLEEVDGRGAARDVMPPRAEPAWLEAKEELLSFLRSDRGEAWGAAARVLVEPPSIAPRDVSWQVANEGSRLVIG